MEAAGLTVSRQYQIGLGREAHVPELRAGNIDVIPSTGQPPELLDRRPARDAEGIQAALLEALPANLTVLEPAQAHRPGLLRGHPATAERYQLTSIADLKALGRAVTIAANSELATCPTGPRPGERLRGQGRGGARDLAGRSPSRPLTDGDVDVADICHRPARGCRLRPGGPDRPAGA